MNAYIYAAIGGIILAFMFLIKKISSSSKDAGKAEAAKEISEQIQVEREKISADREKEMSDVEKIRDRLDSDSDYANRVRNEFTRDSDSSS